MQKVFISAKIPQLAVDILKEHNIEVSMYESDELISELTLMEAVKDIDYLITPLSTKITKKVIDCAPNLKLIANFGAGFNNIDIQYAKEKNVLVTNTPDVSTTAVAELTIGLMLSISHRVVEGDHLMRHEGFNGWAPLFFLGNELSGKNLGIVGLGSIGTSVAQIAKHLNMNVSYYKRTRLSLEKEHELGVTYKSFDELISSSDFISINAPLNNNRHQFNEDVFKKMKDSSFLINVGRGPIVDEEALATALKNKEIAGAALDVYEHEPKVVEKLKKMKNVILTPHIGNATIEARNAMAKIVAENVIAINENSDVKYIVNK